MAQPTEPEFGFDVFVSYRQSEPDITWVREILVPSLDSGGLDVCVDYRSFELGVAVITSMAAAVQSSRYTVAVMSPSYFQSEFTTLERIMAQHLGLEEGQRRLIGLMLEETEVPTEIRPFLWLDVSKVRDASDSKLSRLIDALRKPPD